MNDQDQMHRAMPKLLTLECNRAKTGGITGQTKLTIGIICKAPGITEVPTTLITRATLKIESLTMIGSSIKLDDNKTWLILTMGIKTSMEVKAAMIAARSELMVTTITQLSTKIIENGKTDHRETSTVLMIQSARVIKEIKHMANSSKLHQNLYLSTLSQMHQLLCQRPTKSRKSNTWIHQQWQRILACLARLQAFLNQVLSLRHSNLVPNRTLLLK